MSTSGAGGTEVQMTGRSNARDADRGPYQQADPTCLRSKRKNGMDYSNSKEQ